MRTLTEIETWGFTEADLDKKSMVHIPNTLGLFAQPKEWTLREIRDALTNAYCGKIGVEYMHIPDREQCNWIR